MEPWLAAHLPVLDLALDAVRAVQRNPECAEALLADLAAAGGGHPDYDAGVTALTATLRQGPDPAAARRLCSLAARTFAAGLLIRQAPPDVADLYCATRLGWAGERAFGELPSGTVTRRIADAVTPLPTGGW